MRNLKETSEGCVPDHDIAQETLQEVNRFLRSLVRASPLAIITLKTFLNSIPCIEKPFDLKHLKETIGRFAERLRK